MNMRPPATRIFFCILACLFFSFGPGRLSAEETAGETARVTSIIDKVIAAYGGKEVADGIHSLHMKGKIEAFMLRDHGTYELYFKRERKLRVETKYAHGFEVRVLNGDRGYRASGTLPLEEVHGPRFFSMVYQYKHLDIIHDLAKGAYQIQAMGESFVGGNKTGILRLSDKEGAIIDIHVDARNFLIVKVTAYFTEANKKIDLSSEFSDFKKVEGSVFPFTITNYAGGLKIAQTVIEKYSVNPDISDSFFAPSLIHSL